MQNIPNPVWKAIAPCDPRFQRAEHLFAGYTLTDFVSTDTTDCSPIIQALLNKLGEIGGGALYIPAGEYACYSPIELPIGTTILGDWQIPDGKSPVEGTILAYYGEALSEEFNTPFIVLNQSTEVRGIAVWYPNQSVSDPIPYPPALRPSWWSIVKEITLINPWIGVAPRDCDSPNIHNVYGTPLSIGIRVPMVTDIMRIEETYFAPDYWVNSGKFNGDEAALRTYLYENATGIYLYRTDWSYCTDTCIDGYHNGFVMDAGGCYGQNYNITIKNCYHAIYAPFTHGNGQEITFSRIENCEYGLYIPEGGTYTAVTFQDVEIDAKTEAISVHNASKLTLVDSTVKGGRIYSNVGMMIVMNSRFENAEDIKIVLEGKAAANLAGNVGLSENNIIASGEEVVYQLTADTVPNVVSYRLNEKQTAQAKMLTKAPTCRNAFAADTLAAELGVTLDMTGKTDASAALNACLEKVGETGGTLFLPTGHYLLQNTVYVPADTEVCGAANFAQLPYNIGSVIDVVFYGHAFELSARAGIRAVTFCNPTQTAKNADETGKLIPFDYNIYAKDAPDVYAINVSSFNTYNGVLFDGCDRHYIDGLSGLYMNRGAVVMNSRDGIIRDAQFNLQPLMRGYGWPQDLNFRGMVAMHFFEHLQHECYTFVLDNVQDEMVFGCFTYGSAKALKIAGDDTTAVTIGFAADYVTQPVDVHGGKYIVMLNTQMTPFAYKNYTFTPVTEIAAIRTRDTFKGVLDVANIEPWTQPHVIFWVDGGTMNVTNINSGCGVTMGNTYVDEVQLSRLGENAKLNLTGFLQYSPTVQVEDASVANCGFCGAAGLITAPNMMKSPERFGE
ncbi:MAG: hypothetical protein E7549_01055 [Ruminococcaceae bacterium]|nr:hypothetical protein [Oscillospiraceae bacterium]